MKLLLDTHIFIWLATDPGKLPLQARAACQDLNNTLVLSVASVWEIQIKHQLGKLTLVTPLERIIADQQVVNAITLLPVELTHVLALHALPPLHRDPFDRILVAQARVEEVVETVDTYHACEHLGTVAAAVVRQSARRQSGNRGRLRRRGRCIYPGGVGFQSTQCSCRLRRSCAILRIVEISGG